MDIARFWNISDPEEAIGALISFVGDERFSHLQVALDDNLVAACGMDAAALTADHACGMLYADQIMNSLNQLRATIATGLRDPNDLYNRIAEQAQQATGAIKNVKN